MRIRIACGLDSRSWAGFWKNDRAAVRAVRTIQYNNLLFYLLFIIYYTIYTIHYSTHWPPSLSPIAIGHPVTAISCGPFVQLAVKWPLGTRRVSRIAVRAVLTYSIDRWVCLVGKGRLEERCGLDWGRIGLGADWFGVRIRFEDIRYILSLFCDFRPAGCSQNMATYLHFSVCTSGPLSLLATIKSSLFIFAGIYAWTQYTNITSINQKLMYNVQFIAIPSYLKRLVGTF